MKTVQDELIRKVHPIMQGAGIKMELSTFLNHVHKTADAYGIAIQKCLDIARQHPIFLAYDHENFLRDAAEAYGNKNIPDIKRAALKHYSFVKRNHVGIMRKLKDMYGAKDAYGVENTPEIVHAILSYPQFVDISHERAINDAQYAYGIENIDKIKKAFLIQPSFALKDHARIINEKSRLVKLCKLGFSRKEIVDVILERPALGGCSYHRDIAIIDIFRQIGGRESNAERLRITMNRYSASPYVPGTYKKRISSFAEAYVPGQPGRERKRMYHLENFGEPPFMTGVLASLEHPRKRKAV